MSSGAGIQASIVSTGGEGAYAAIMTEHSCYPPCEARLCTVTPTRQ